MKYMTVKVTFTEKVLGTCPADPEIYRKFIASCRNCSGSQGCACDL